MINRAALFESFKSSPDYDPTHVYVIARANSDLDGPVKVGLARNPRQRLQTFQTATPFPVRLHTTFLLPTRALAYDVESTFHKGVQNRHLHGEWFSCGPAHAEKVLRLVIAISIHQNLPQITEDEKKAVFDFIAGCPA